MSAPTAPMADSVEFNPYSETFFNNPYDTYRRLRDEAPLYHNAEYGFWAISRYEDIAPAYKDSATFSSAKGVTLDMIKIAELLKGIPPQLIMLDPPEHDRMRRLVSKAFTPRAVKSWAALVTETIHGFFDDIADPTSFDAVGEFAALFPVEIICRILGVPAEYRQQIRLWIDTYLAREPGNMMMSQAGAEASIAMGQFFEALLAERKAAPRDDMLSELIAAEYVDTDGETKRLSDEEIIGFCRLLGGAGAETVTKLISNALVVFADHPDQWEALRQDRDKVPDAIEELVRFDGPLQYNFRVTTREVTFYGETIPADSPIMLITGAANRDDRVFENPDVFDINRKRPFGYNLGFGYGTHSCLGAPLARMESRVALNLLLDKLPRYEIDRSNLSRVSMTNVAGWKSVPVRALPAE